MARRKRLPPERDRENVLEAEPLDKYAVIRRGLLILVRAGDLDPQDDTVQAVTQRLRELTEGMPERELLHMAREVLDMADREIVAPPAVKKGKGCGSGGTGARDHAYASGTGAQGGP